MLNENEAVFFYSPDIKFELRTRARKRKTRQILSTRIQQICEWLGHWNKCLQMTFDRVRKLNKKKLHRYREREKNRENLAVHKGDTHRNIYKKKKYEIRVKCALTYFVSAFSSYVGRKKNTFAWDLCSFVGLWWSHFEWVCGNVINRTISSVLKCVRFKRLHFWLRFFLLSSSRKFRFDVN